MSTQQEGQSYGASLSLARPYKRVVVRYSLKPLADLLGIQLEQLGRRLKVNGATWQEYRDLGVSELVADRMAVKVGVDPYQVWPEMLDAAIAAAEMECASGCGTRFLPGQPSQRFCSRRCKQREAWRRRWATMTTEERAAQLERVRRYKAAARPIHLRKRRLKYAAEKAAA